MTEYLPTVLFVCTDWYEVGGAGASLMDHIEALRGDLVPIVLVYAEGEMSRRLRMMGVEVVAAQFFYLWECPKPLKEVLRNPLRATVVQSYLRNMLCVRKVKTWLGDRRVDVVHSNSSVTTVGCNIAYVLGAKHVWHVREYLDLAFGIEIYGGRERLRRKLRQADYRICVSDAVRRHWELTDDCSAVVHDTVKIAVPSATGIAREPWVLFCATHITTGKGAETAVDSFCRSGVWQDGYSLVMVGNCDAGYKSELLAMAARHGCAEAIRFDGFCQDVARYFVRASVFVMASLYEGLGRVTVEAMLAGCPVVARRSGGTLDIIEHGRTGFLFDTDDECAALLRQLTACPDTTVAKHACAFAQHHFSPQHYREQVLPIYRSLFQY